jgi:hypothetical protein
MFFQQENNNHAPLPEENICVVESREKMRLRRMSTIMVVARDRLRGNGEDLIFKIIPFY